MATVLVTGANRGIGLALCQRFAARGDRVIAVCRQSSAELDALGVRVEAGVDVSDGAAVDALAERQQERLDRVVLNAGVLGRESLDELDDAAFARMRQQFEVNALAPLRCAAAMIPRLAAGAKIAIITSRMGSIGDNTSGGYYGYRMSKAAVNAAAVSLAHDLKPRGIAVCVLHPGYVQTRMTGRQGDVSPEQAASGLIERIDALDLAHSGSFWHANGAQLPW